MHPGNHKSTKTCAKLYMQGCSICQHTGTAMPKATYPIYRPMIDCNVKTIDESHATMQHRWCSRYTNVYIVHWHLTFRAIAICHKHDDVHQHDANRGYSILEYEIDIPKFHPVLAILLRFREMVAIFQKA